MSSVPQNNKYSKILHGLMIAGCGLGIFLSNPIKMAQANIDADHSSAVIFTYQRIGEDTLPTSNISLDRFKSHIEELKTDGYNVLSLDDIIDALKNKKTLPHKTVGITLDGAWRSTRQHAIPILEEAKLPYTIFFATDMAATGEMDHMTWDELKKTMKSKYASLGIMPAAYAHIANMNIDQSSALINKAVSKYREEIGKDPAFFAYPYGEYTAALKQQIATYDFQAAFGQQSGVASSASDFTALPRFIMTDAYSDLDRFQLTANALPLPVTDIMPEDTLFTNNPPMIGFTVNENIKNLSSLSCFISGQGKSDIKTLPGNRVEIRPTEEFTDRRTRINCTIPEEQIIPGELQNWRWFGMQMINQNFAEELMTTTNTGLE